MPGITRILGLNYYFLARRLLSHAISPNVAEGDVVFGLGPKHEDESVVVSKRDRESIDLRYKAAKKLEEENV